MTFDDVQRAEWERIAALYHCALRPDLEPTEEFLGHITAAGDARRPSWERQFVHIARLLSSGYLVGLPEPEASPPSTAPRVEVPPAPLSPAQRAYKWQAALAARKALTRCIGDVNEKEVRWLWPGRIPEGRITVILGRMGAGKSTLLGWLASTVSTGRPWPDSNVPNESGSVLYLQAEESVSQDLKPRLVSMQADTRRVHEIKAVQIGDVEHPFSLGRDAELLAAEIERLKDVRLVLIDPIGAYLQGMSGNNDSEVRSVLQPIKNLAESKGVTIVIAMHPNKDQTKDILDRATGAGAFLQVARMAWYFSEDPRDRSRRLLSLLKGNIRGATRTAIALSLNRKHQIVWRPGAYNILGRQVDASLQRQAMEEKLQGIQRAEVRTGKAARRFILEYLEKGPSWASIVHDQAEAVGFKESTFRRLGLKRLIERGDVEQYYGETDGRKWIRLVRRPEPEPDSELSQAPPAAADEPHAVDDEGLGAWFSEGGA